VSAYVAGRRSSQVSIWLMIKFTLAASPKLYQKDEEWIAYWLMAIDRLCNFALL